MYNLDVFWENHYSIRCVKKLIKSNCMYFTMKILIISYSVWFKTMIRFLVVNVHYTANISQNPRVKNSKYICKEIKLYYLECPSLVNYEKQNARAHTYTNINAWTLIYTHTHTHTNKHTHTCMHTKTHACTWAWLACTHTHKVFFRNRRPECVEPLAG